MTREAVHSALMTLQTTASNLGSRPAVDPETFKLISGIIDTVVSLRARNNAGQFFDDGKLAEFRRATTVTEGES